MARRVYVEARDDLLNEDAFASTEKDFLASLYHADLRDLEHARIASDFRLVHALRQQAQALKEQAKSGDRHSRIMGWMTAALILFAAVEAISTLLQVLTIWGTIGPR